jgi:hypothetical protein
VLKHLKQSHKKTFPSLSKQVLLFKRFACPKCPLRSKFKVNILRHLETQHPRAEAKPEAKPPATQAEPIPRVAKKPGGSESPSSAGKKCAEMQKPGKITRKPLDKSKPGKIVRKPEAKSMPEAKPKAASKPSSQQSCSKCPFVARSHPELIVHYDKWHIRRGTDRRCPHCPYRTSLAVLLTSHVITTHSKCAKNLAPAPNVWHWFL